MHDEVPLLRPRQGRPDDRRRDTAGVAGREMAVVRIGAAFGGRRPGAAYTNAAGTDAARSGACRATGCVGGAGRCRGAAAGLRAATPGLAAGFAATTCAAATATAVAANSTTIAAAATAVAAAATAVAAAATAVAAATTAVAATAVAATAVAAATVAAASAAVAPTTAAVAAATAAAVAAATTAAVAAATTAVATTTVAAATTAAAAVAATSTTAATAAAAVAAATTAAAAVAATASAAAPTTTTTTTTTTTGVSGVTEQRKARRHDRQRRRDQKSGRETRKQPTQQRLATTFAGNAIGLDMNGDRHGSPNEKLRHVNVVNVRHPTRPRYMSRRSNGLHPTFARGTIRTRMQDRASGSARRLIGLLVLLAGCGANPPAAQLGLPIAPVPEFGVGDSYRFNDGTAASVTAIDRDTVHWRGATGTYVTARDVLLPSLAWADGTAQGERRIAATPPLLFPLRPGKSVAFGAARTVRPRSGGPSVTVRENWRCNVAGTAHLDTVAGGFDTWRVDCSMTELPAAPGGVVVQRSFYYAPEIGFYVRRDERMGDNSLRQIELVDYTTAEPALPDSALRLRIARIQQALENDLSGNSRSWNDPATGDDGEVLPLRTVRSRQYGWCRDFSEHIRAAGRSYNLQGTGCRNAAGIWDIVELGPARNGSS